MFAAMNLEGVLMRAAWSIGATLPWILLLLLTRRWRCYPLLWLLVTAFAVFGDMILFLKFFGNEDRSSAGGPVAPFGTPIQYVVILSAFAAVPTTLFVFTCGLPRKRNPHQTDHRSGGNPPS